MREQIAAEALACMRRALRHNGGFRRDMARSKRRGADYWAEVLMEARLVDDYCEGRIPNMKRLIAEVSPEWVGHSSAKRILHRLAEQGMIELTPDQDDLRNMAVVPTEALFERNDERWRRIVD